MQEDDKQISDAITQGNDTVKQAEGVLAVELTNIEIAASDTTQAAIGIEQAAFDVSKAQAQQASDITAQRIAEVRAEVLKDNAELKAGQYKRL